MSLHVTTISMMRLLNRLTSVAAIGLALSVGPGFAQPEALETKAREFLQLFFGGKADQLAPLMDEAMNTAFPPDEMERIVDAVQAQAGLLQSMLESELTQTAGFEIVFVTCQFERTRLKARVVYNGEGLVAGLQFVPAGPEAKASDPADTDQEKREEEATEVVEEATSTERRNLRPGGSDSEIKAAQMIAEMELARRRHADVAARGAVENFITYEFTIEGEDDASIIKEAMVRALMNTASRLYFDDTILLGRDLLRPYLSVYGDRFVARRRVLDRHILAGGNLRLKVSVGVDKVRLYADLEQKHFLAEPKFRPFVAVLIEETEGGLPKAEGLGRSVLEEALRRNELKIESERMAGYGLNIDAAANPQIFRETREEAQRWDIDVLVTGSVDVIAKESRVILYDQVFFTEGRLKLKVIRVDTGEVLREDKDHYSASGSTAEDAYKTLLENMINRTVEKLADGFLSDWANLMLDLSDYRLMISGVDDDALENISSMLKTLSPNLRLFVKSYYGNVAVLNIVYPDAKPGEVEDFLRQSRAPQLRIRYTDQRRMEIEVL